MKTIFKIQNKTMILLYFIILTGCENSEQQVDTDLNTNTFQQQIESRAGYFILDVETETGQMPPVGEYHSWLVTVTDKDQRPIYPAIFSVTGGMAEHGHGLPTQPIVKEYLGDGRYLLQGLKFTMDGDWFIRFEVLTKELQDTAELNFHVSY